MTSLQTTLLYILNYLPPVLVGVYVFRKMKVRYKRPLHSGIDPRVYVITLFSAALTLLVLTLLIYYLVSVFYSGYTG